MTDFLRIGLFLNLVFVFNLALSGFSVVVLLDFCVRVFVYEEERGGGKFPYVRWANLFERVANSLPKMFKNI